MSFRFTIGLLVPMAMMAHEYGPDPRYTAAPGDDPLACSTSGCHTGLPKGGPLNPAGGGVTVTFSGGLTYTPGGAPITITVTVTDPKNTHYGFQMTARLESDLANGQAGDFTAGKNQIVICDDNSEKIKSCPAGSLVQFIEHNYPAGSQVGTTPYTFTWTPPAVDVGNIHFYIAGNSVNGNIQSDAGDHVYTSSYVMSRALPPFTCTNSTKPVISSIDSASGYGGYAYFASGTWLEIKGTNLADAADPRMALTTNPGQWTASDFNGVNAPTTLDGISVSINGKPAYVWYLSPGQINVQAPQDTATGNVSITVTNCNATSAPITFARKTLAPGFLAPGNYAANGTNYLVATFNSDGAYVLNTATGASFGLSSRPAKPGDLIVAYGIGFGDVTPTILPGVIVGAGNALVNPVVIKFGSVNAPIVYQGLAGSFVGLYEFYFNVPTGLANGDYVINVTQNGVAVPQTMSLTVHN